MSKKVLVTGATGFLGSNLVEELREMQYKVIESSSRDDLRLQHNIDNLLEQHEPNYVIHLAGNVGGIGKNKERPADLIYDNTMMGFNVIESCRKYDIEKLVVTGTICSYPSDCPIPFNEKHLFNGFPEETNAPYGVSKRAIGVALDAYYRQYGLNSTLLLPLNLMGPRDHFNTTDSHVIPSLIVKMTEAIQNGDQNIECWGTGKATRSFLYVKDCVDAIIKSLNKDTGPQPINVGGAEEISIYDLVYKIADKCGFNGEIIWDDNKPDGQLRRAIDYSRAQEVLGWKPRVDLDDALNRTISWYKCHKLRSV